MSVKDRPTPADVAAYAIRVERVARKFNTIGWGSRQAAAFDLRIHQSRVSQILRQADYDPDTLDRLDAWAEERLAASSSS
jgi:hypothetical protein